MGKSKKDESCESDSDCEKGLICYEKGYLSNINEDPEFSNKCQNLTKLI